MPTMWFEHSLSIRQMAPYTTYIRQWSMNILLTSNSSTMLAPFSLYQHYAFIWPIFFSIMALNASFVLYIVIVSSFWSVLLPFHLPHVGPLPRSLLSNLSCSLGPNPSSLTYRVFSSLFSLDWLSLASWAWNNTLTSSSLIVLRSLDSVGFWLRRKKGSKRESSEEDKRHNWIKTNFTCLN